MTRRRRTVAPGLPFLVLVQLGRIGYLDAVAAIGSATGEPLAAQVVAAGLAGKVLPAPQRGWRRDTAELEAVAAASGLPPDDVDALAHALRNEVRVCVPPLESALIALYAAGRAASDEVVVTSTAEGVVFGEPGGSLPIGWLSDRRGLDGALAQLGGPPVRRTDTFATFMSELAARTAFPHLGLTGLERHLGAAVGAALGSIAQELWGVETAGAGEDAPLLALERLGDLEVELRWDDVLAVAVPRGRRWLDLGRAGLLDQWAVPWAAGGVWELVSW